MKRQLYIAMPIIILVTVLTAGARAQSASAQRVIATIPFAFHVGEKQLPAGKYTITITNPSSDRKILQLRNANGRSTAMILTTNALGNVAEEAKLVFHRYGDRYFFAQARMAGDATSLAVVKSKAERAEQEMVVKSRRSVVVILAE